MPSLPKNTPEIAVAVVGLPSCEAACLHKDGDNLSSDYGVGKTDLCRRFALPCFDDFAACEHTERYSVVDAGEFTSNRKINAVHYLYYGRAARTWADKTVIFHVVEHTTISGPDRCPHGGTLLPYADRIEASLSCPAKVACVTSRREGPTQYCRFPSEAFSGGPDGYVFVLDCSAPERVLQQQLDLAEDLARRLNDQARPMAIAFSKCDVIDAEKIREVRDGRALFSSVPFFELSSKSDVGVDYPFFHVFAASRQNDGFSYAVPGRPYAILAQSRTLAVSQACAELETMLADRVKDIDVTWPDVVEKAGRSSTLAALLCLCGQHAVVQRFRQRLVRLKISAMERKVEEMKEEFRDTVRHHPNLSSLTGRMSELESSVFANFCLPNAELFTWPVQSSSSDGRTEARQPNEGISSSHCEYDRGDVDGDVSACSDEIRRCYTSAANSVLSQDSTEDDYAYFCPAALRPDPTCCQILQRLLKDDSSAVDKESEDVIPGMYIDLVSPCAARLSSSESDSADEVDTNQQAPSPPDVPQRNQASMTRCRADTEPIILVTSGEQWADKETSKDKSPFKRRFIAWKDKDKKEKEPKRKETALEKNARKMRAKMEKEREKQGSKGEKEKGKLAKEKSGKIGDATIKKGQKVIGRVVRHSLPEITPPHCKSRTTKSSSLSPKVDVTVEVSSDCSNDEMKDSNVSSDDGTTADLQSLSASSTGEGSHISFSLPSNDLDRLSANSCHMLNGIQEPLPVCADPVHSDNTPLHSSVDNTGDDNVYESV